jgi:diguanylate cyclase (GGDEF)-like protein
VKAWPIWALKPALRGYVLAVIVAGAAATVAAATTTSWRASDGFLFSLLLVFGAITVETLRRVGEPAGSIKDAHGVWQLATAVLLPPFYAVTAAIVVFSLTQWRVRRSVAYRRVFSTAAIGLSYGAASVFFHAVRPGLPGPGRGREALAWVALAAAAALLRWAINNALVLAAVRLDDPAARPWDLLGGADGLWADVAECSVGVLVALAAAFTPLMLLLALPCGTMLQRSSRHRQLVHASRTDPKTGLLSATTWQAEADVQIARARRTRDPLAVLMIDIDHFKKVNDTHGHLAGDAVLAAAADVLRDGLRPYDLAGRFGGEEFVVLLSGADVAQARQLAERLRAQLSDVTIGRGDPRTAGPRITVSIGVAVLTTSVADLTDLLAAADAALYQAKNAGRNLVHLAGEPTPR